MNQASEGYLSTLAMTHDLSGLHRPNGISNLAPFDHFFIVVMGTDPYPYEASAIFDSQCSMSLTDSC